MHVNMTGSRFQSFIKMRHRCRSSFLVSFTRWDGLPGTEPLRQPERDFEEG